MSSSLDITIWINLFEEALFKLWYKNKSLWENWNAFIQDEENNIENKEEFTSTPEFFSKNSPILINALWKLFNESYSQSFNASIQKHENNLNFHIHGNQMNTINYFLKDQWKLLETITSFKKTQWEFHKGKLTYQEFEESISCFWESLWEYSNYLHSLNTPSEALASSEKSELLIPHTEILDAIWDEDVIYRVFQWKIYFFKWEKAYIESIDLRDTNLGESLLKIKDDYQLVKLIEFVPIQPQSNLTIWLSVGSMENIHSVEVPRTYAQMFQDFSKKWFKYILEESHQEWFRIIALYWDNVVADIQNKHDFALDFFFKTLDSYNIWDEKYNQALEVKVNSSESKIQFVNRIYDDVTQKEYLPSLYEMLTIWWELWLGWQEIFWLIQEVFPALEPKIPHIYEHIIQNHQDYLIPWTEILKQKDINLNNYWLLRSAYNSYFFGTINALISKNKDISTVWLFNIIESIYRMDFTRGLDSNFSEVQWVPALLIVLLKKALWNNPSLFESSDMQLYFQKFPQLKSMLLPGQATRQANTQILSNPTGSWLDLATANRIQWEQDIFLRIRDMKIAWLESLTPKEIAEIKLCIARNLAINNLDDIESFLISFDSQKELLIQQELADIFTNRREILPKTIFSNKALFHMAHYGQWVDAFWTPWTQSALKAQIWNNEYTLFDAQDIKWQNLTKKKSSIQHFYEKFIKSNHPSTFLAEWHANANWFSIIDDYEKSDKLEITKTKHSILFLVPKDMADIIIKRSHFRKINKFEWEDIIIFAACKWDYVMKVIIEINNRKNEYEKEWIILPTIITAAEAWENSTFRIKEYIPYDILRIWLRIWEGTPPFFDTLYKNQHHKDLWSNPWVFYPNPRNNSYRQLF